MALLYYRPSNTIPKLAKNDKRHSMGFSMRYKHENSYQEAHIEVFIKGEYKGYMIAEYKGCPRWYFCTSKNPFGELEAGVYNTEQTIQGKALLIEKIKEHFGVE